MLPLGGTRLFTPIAEKFKIVLKKVGKDFQIKNVGSQLIVVYSTPCRLLLLKSFPTQMCGLTNYHQTHKLILHLMTTVAVRHTLQQCLCVM